jgi:hypothetical protein
MIDDSTIQVAKTRHGEVVHLEGAGEEILVRRPTRADWMRFRKLGMGPKRHLAAERLLRDCCVHPALDALDALLERRPAAAESFVERLLELAGADPATRATVHR